MYICNMYENSDYAQIARETRNPEDQLDDNIKQFGSGLADMRYAR